MKRSVSVTLSLVVALGTARAQQIPDPCNEGTFNSKACQAAIRGGAYCSNGARVRTAYAHSYPYYYDRYQDYVAQGGMVNASPAQACPGRWFGVVRGGFGSTGAGQHAGS
jgi:hypothetical protein